MGSLTCWFDDHPYDWDVLEDLTCVVSSLRLLLIRVHEGNRQIYKTTLSNLSECFVAKLSEKLEQRLLHLGLLMLGQLLVTQGVEEDWSRFEDDVSRL